MSSCAKVSSHNKEVRAVAEYRATEMGTWPSPLEERMKGLLDLHGIEYEFQRIFCIYADDGWIIRYYIADFYIPGKGIILEVDGKFHDGQRQHDKERTRIIQEHYPEVDVIRWTSKDFSSQSKVNWLIEKLQR